MVKLCDFCDEPFKDGEIIRVIADTRYKELPSRVVYALSEAMEVHELYHTECLDYVIGGGK